MKNIDWLSRETLGAKLWRLPVLKKAPGISTTIVYIFIFVTAAFLYSVINHSVDNVITVSKENKRITQTDELKKIQEKVKIKERIEIPLYCSSKNVTQMCPSNYPKAFRTKEPSDDSSASSTCPEYFRWIHEDLKLFKATGITRNMVNKAKMTAHFRLVIVQGKVYIEKFRKSIQTRDVFTIWGILQLLRRYPGRLPDLELMFDTDDKPVVKSHLYRRLNAPTPPLFRYCGDQWTSDIVFPDWSFWGWAEINIKPWEIVLKEMKEGNSKVKWMEREPYAYWKGNPFVVDNRKDLLKCNVSQEHDWNARLFVQDWIREGQQGFQQSNVANQCTYKYKIYIEGYAWSVSEKYIFACDSVTLLVKPDYYDFFVRSLMPLEHYWPINKDDKCRSIEHAVEWGNLNAEKAHEIGKAASTFIQDELKMDYVYDYMFHLLNEYAKLLRFEPKIPEKAVEFCSETMACNAEGTEKKFKMDSLVKSPSLESPCTMPSPYNPKVFGNLARQKAGVVKQVEMWKNSYWSSVS
ncbi:Glycosyltransferase [Heracleum sosnowskyi]|uniref:Glycosyltransferase n=1 Tax=Heracleum sosnowskyi TaxID=360622 RepID=A0AAD8LW85_9APIA|nr:Glycosyltransferase [Heracleum sosnowskyi]